MQARIYSLRGEQNVLNQLWNVFGERQRKWFATL